MRLVQWTVALSLFVTACGNGSNSRPRTTMPTNTPPPTQRPAEPPQQPSMPQPSMPEPSMPPPFRSVVFPNYDLTQGTKSSHAAAVATLQTRRTDGVLRSFQARRRAGCTQSQILNHTCPPAVPSDKLPVVTIDTHAEAAWRQGWTGKGVEVAIVDSSGSHADHTYTVTASVAPEADINLLRTNLRIGLSQQLLGGALQTLDSNAKRQYDTLAIRHNDGRVVGNAIVNNSFGYDLYRSPSSRGLSFDLIPFARQQIALPGFLAVMRPAANTDSYPENMLFIYSAGNGRARCPHDTLDECRPQAAGLLKLRETEKDAGDRVIFVGSLADGANTIADYSYTAGKLQNDFIVAHDDVWSAGDTGGTSFAAPRVTGAAALVRHKFPNLNGPQLKQVLLQSADDLGTPGPDAVFGYGKLNIMSALSPIDGLTK